MIEKVENGDSPNLDACDTYAIVVMVPHVMTQIIKEERDASSLDSVYTLSANFVILACIHIADMRVVWWLPLDNLDIAMSACHGIASTIVSMQSFQSPDDAFFSKFPVPYRDICILAAMGTVALRAEHKENQDFYMSRLNAVFWTPVAWYPSTQTIERLGDDKPTAKECGDEIRAYVVPRGEMLN